MPLLSDRSPSPAPWHGERRDRPPAAALATSTVHAIRTPRSCGACWTAILPPSRESTTSAIKPSTVFACQLAQYRPARTSPPPRGRRLLRARLSSRRPRRLSFWQARSVRAANFCAPSRQPVLALRRAFRPRRRGSAPGAQSQVTCDARRPHCLSQYDNYCYQFLAPGTIVAVPGAMGQKRVGELHNPSRFGRVVLHISDPIRLVRMVHKVEWLE